MAKATTIRELLVKIGVRADTDDVDVLDKRLDAAKNNMAAFAKVAAGLTAVIAATATGMFVLAGNVSSIGDEIGKASKRAMTGAEDFQELSFAAAEAGVSVSSLENALKRQLLSLGSAKQGAKLQVDAFNAVGLSLEEASKLGQRDLFGRIADGLNGIDDDATRARVSMDIFGRAGLDLGPLLAGGAEGIDAAAKAARELGIVLDAEAIASTERYTDSMGRLTASFGAFKNKVGVVVIEALLPVIDAINDFTARNQRLIETLVDLTPMVLALATSISGLAAIGVVLASIGFLVSGLSALAAIVGAAAAAIGVGLLPFIGILAAGLAGLVAHVALAVSAFVAIGLAIDDVLTYLRGGDSLLGRFIDRWKETDGVLGVVARSSEDMVAIMVELFTIVKDLASVAWDLSIALGSFVGDKILDGFRSLASMLGEVFGFDASPLMDTFATFEGFISSILSGLKAVSSFTGALSGIVGESKGMSGFGALGNMASNAASSVSNSVSQTITNNITGSDPVKIGEEVRRAMDVQHRRAAEVLAGGLR